MSEHICIAGFFFRMSTQVRILAFMRVLMQKEKPVISNQLFNVPIFWLLAYLMNIFPKARRGQKLYMYTCSLLHYYYKHCNLQKFSLPFTLSTINIDANSKILYDMQTWHCQWRDKIHDRYNLTHTVVKESFIMSF